MTTPEKFKTKSKHPIMDSIDYHKDSAHWTTLPADVCVSHAPMLTVSRYVGLAPIIIRETPTGGQMVQWSPRLAASGCTLGVLLVLFALAGALSDLLAGKRNSVRMTNITTIAVTCCDIFSVLFITVVGVIGAPLRLRSLSRYYKELGLADDILKPMDADVAKKNSLTVMGIVLSYITLVLSADITCWMQRATKKGLEHYFIRNYIFFYLTYYVVILLELQFLHGAYAVQRRLRRLNEWLETFDDSERRLSDLALFANGEAALVDVMSMRRDANGHRRSSVQRRSAERITRLRIAHGRLCEAVRELNDAFEFTALVIIISCLLHLIETPYFLLVNMAGEHDGFYDALQLIWLSVHIGRLMLIVQPSYAASYEAKITSRLICRLLCVDFDASIGKQLELFALQILHRPVEFTVCGLCTLDRPLLSAIAGAVTTYLVILIQFDD